MSFLTTTETAFGLDISDRALRLIQLKRKGSTIRVQAHNEIALPSTYLTQNQAAQNATLTEALRKLIKTRHGRSLSEEAVVALPEAKTFIKVIAAPATSDALPTYLSEILPQHIPLALTEMYYDWQYTDEAHTHILVGAVARTIVDAYVEILNTTRLLPAIFEIEAAAIMRAMIMDDDHRAQLIVDFGATRTSVIMCDKNMVQFTVSLPISGNAVTQLITETLDIAYEQAEQAKIVCGLDASACQGALRELFTPTITELITQIKKTIDYYQQNSSNTADIARVIFTGGGANFKQLRELAQDQLHIPVEISDPWKKVINPNPSYFTPERSQSYVTAIGLGLRGLDVQTTI